MLLQGNLRNIETKTNLLKVNKNAMKKKNAYILGQN